MRQVLLDASVIIPLFDRSDRRHRDCVEGIEATEGALITCEAAIAESCHILRKLPGAAAEVLENVRRGSFRIPLSLTESSEGVLQILRKYRDRRVSLADACLVHLANELNCGDILTLDSDFRVYRWGGNKPFRLIPE